MNQGNIDKTFLKAEDIINCIAESVEKRFEGHPKAEEVTDDIRHSIDGFMNECEIGAMVVDLIKTLTEDQKPNQKEEL